MIDLSHLLMQIYVHRKSSFKIEKISTKQLPEVLDDIREYCKKYKRVDAILITADCTYARRPM